MLFYELEIFFNAKLSLCLSCCVWTAAKISKLLGVVRIVRVMFLNPTGRLMLVIVLDVKLKPSLSLLVNLLDELD